MRGYMTTPEFNTEIHIWILFFELLKYPIEPIPVTNRTQKYYLKLGSRIQQLTLITKWNDKMFNIAVWTNTIFAIYMT